jgi:hypothetical protein
MSRPYDAMTDPDDEGSTWSFDDALSSIALGVLVLLAVAATWMLDAAMPA